MNRLEELAGKLSSLTPFNSEDSKVLDEAAAILLAASKVDVAGLMELSGAAGKAAHLWVLNPTIENAETMATSTEKLETALRMALATKGEHHD